MALLLRDEAPPDVAVSLQPHVGAGMEDVVRQEIIVAKGGDDGNVQAVLVGGKGGKELVSDYTVGPEDLGTASGVLFITVVACCIACPDYKVNVVLEMLFDPVKGCADKRERRIAVCKLSSISPCETMTPMACYALPCGGPRLVEIIRVEIYHDAIGLGTG